MQSALLRYLLRRIARALVLVFVVASAAMLLVHLAPGDAFSTFDLPPSVAAAERARLGLDRPFVEQYAAWLGRVVLLDFGESSRFHRPVSTLLAERAGNTVLLGSAAVFLAIGFGIPAGVLTGGGSRQRWTLLVRAASLLLVATPPLVTALVLLLVAARTGWLPAGGAHSSSGSGALTAGSDLMKYLALPALALALPIAASLERLQARALEEALADPCVAAARARGVSRRRAIWSHAFPLSLNPVLAVLGIVVGTALSGSFVVEIVMSWPGLGDLMYQALVGRDVHLAAGCAASGAVFLALGLLAADIALAMADPRTVHTP